MLWSCRTIFDFIKYLRNCVWFTLHEVWSNQYGMMLKIVATLLQDSFSEDGGWITDGDTCPRQPRDMFDVAIRREWYDQQPYRIQIIEF